LKDLFECAQYRLIEAYETRIGSLNQMNTALVEQLKEQNYELQQAFLTDEERIAELQAQDKVLH